MKPISIKFLRAQVMMAKPTKIIVPLATGLAWDDRGYRYEEKLDGVFSTREIGGCIVAGELMRSGEFFGFDVLSVDGQDIRCETLGQRLAVLYGLPVKRPATGHGGEFVREVLARGGEGVVAKRLDAAYADDMLAVKRKIELRCIVSAFGDSQSVKIVDAVTGEDRGKVSLFGGKVDRVRLGSIIKVLGMELTANGKVREPRLCQDTPDSWLVKF